MTRNNFHFSLFIFHFLLFIFPFSPFNFLLSPFTSQLSPFNSQLSPFNFSVACAAQSEESVALTDLRRAIALTDATMEKSFTGNDLRMFDTYDTADGTGHGTADVWPYTAALEAHCSVLQALEALKDEAPALYADTRQRYVTRLKSLFNNLAYYAGTYNLYSYASRRRWTIYGVHRSGTRGQAAVTGIENVYDDQMWLCREMVRAYRLTAEKSYLAEATMLANYCIDGWDCCLDANGNEYGGISWGPGYNSKHSCSNGPLIQPLVWLADIYRTEDEAEDLPYYYILPDSTRTSNMRRHSDVYLEMARKVYLWQKEKLLNRSTGVYWDMLGAPGEIQYVKIGRASYRTHVDTGGPTGTAYTYNTGTMLAGAAELYRVTGEQMFLDDLNNLCRSSVTQFSKRRRLDGAVFREWPTDDVATSGFNTWFDDVLMRAFVDADTYNTTQTGQVTHSATALASFQQNLDYAWENHRRDAFLPIHLLDGWGDATVTKGFHQLAFASELAMLACWQHRQAQPDAIGQVKTAPTATHEKWYDLSGRPAQRHHGLQVALGKKKQIRGGF